MSQVFSFFGATLPAWDEEVCSPLRKALPLLHFTTSSATVVPSVYSLLSLSGYTVSIENITAYPQASDPTPFLQIPSVTITLTEYPLDKLLPLLPLYALTWSINPPALNRVVLGITTHGAVKANISLDHCYSERSEAADRGVSTKKKARTSVSHILAKLPPMPTQPTFWKFGVVDIRDGVDVTFLIPSPSSGVGGNECSLPIPLRKIAVPSDVLELVYSATSKSMALPYENRGIDQVHLLSTVAATAKDSVLTKVKNQWDSVGDGVKRWLENALDHAILEGRNLDEKMQQANDVVDKIGKWVDELIDTSVRVIESNRKKMDAIAKSRVGEAKEFLASKVTKSGISEAKDSLANKVTKSGISDAREWIARKKKGAKSALWKQRGVVDSVEEIYEEGE
jgi:hypothetical protein